MGYPSPSPYACLPCNETYDSKKLWDEHLNHEHGMSAGDWP